MRSNDSLVELTHKESIKPVIEEGTGSEAKSWRYAYKGESPWLWGAPCPWLVPSIIITSPLWLSFFAIRATANFLVKTYYKIQGVIPERIEGSGFIFYKKTSELSLPFPSANETPGSYKPL